MQIVAEHAARIGDPGIQQHARALEARRADHHDPRLGVQFAAANGGRTKFAPFTRPVFLSTVISRTTAFGTIVRLPVARASGSSRLKELANCPSPSARRILVTGMPHRLPRTTKRCDGLAVGRVVFDEIAVGKLLRGLPCGRDTRKIGSTRA